MIKEKYCIPCECTLEFSLEKIIIVRLFVPLAAMFGQLFRENKAHALSITNKYVSSSSIY